MGYRSGGGGCPNSLEIDEGNNVDLAEVKCIEKHGIPDRTTCSFLVWTEEMKKTITDSFGRFITWPCLDS